MTPAAGSPAPGARYADLPRTGDVVLPPTGMLQHGRPFAARILRARFRLEVAGAEHVPTTGPVILAGNHLGVLDGPILAIASPRPAHVLTKSQMFVGRTGRFLTAVGQIPVVRNEVDVAAVRTALAVLRDGRALGVFPEARRGAGDLERFESGAGYLALATGAPVVPAILLGTRLPGGSVNSVPPRGGRIALTFGEPLRFDARPWPRHRDEVRETTARIRNAMLDTLRSAVERTGIDLPGPIPEREAGPGPAESAETIEPGIAAITDLHPSPRTDDEDTR